MSFCGSTITSRWSFPATDAEIMISEGEYINKNNMSAVNLLFQSNLWQI